VTVVFDCVPLCVACEWG